MTGPTKTWATGTGEIVLEKMTEETGRVWVMDIWAAPMEATMVTVETTKEDQDTMARAIQEITDHRITDPATRVLTIAVGKNAITIAGLAMPNTIKMTGDGGIEQQMKYPHGLGMKKQKDAAGWTK